VKTLTLSHFTLAFAVAATACSNDDDGDDTAVDSTGTGTTGVAPDTDDDDTTGDVEESADGSGEETTEEVTEAVYAGTVLDFLLEAGIPDAAITVYEAPGFETVSDEDGHYELGPLPLDPPPTFVIDPSEDYFGSVRPVRAAETSNPEDVRLGQVSRAIIDEQIEGLAQQEPAEPDLEESIIIVRLLHAQATGTTLELDPPPEEGTYYAPDAMGRPVLNQSEIQFSLLPVVVYFNVAPADAGTYTFTATHPSRECTIARPDFPTLPGHITLVEVSCPPSS
jgi:hypothetical protein